MLAQGIYMFVTDLSCKWCPRCAEGIHSDKVEADQPQMATWDLFAKAG